MVLTGLLYENFIMNLLNFPNHVIHVRKQNVLKIESIYFSHEYDLNIFFFVNFLINCLMLIKTY